MKIKAQRSPIRHQKYLSYQAKQRKSKLAKYAKVSAKYLLLISLILIAVYLYNNYTNNQKQDIEIIYHIPQHPEYELVTKPH